MTATLTAVQDTIDDDAETVLITASRNSVTIGAQQTVTITDDDAAPTLSVSVNNAAIAEAAGSSTLTVSTGGTTFSSDQTITLTLAGTATKGDDYTISPGSLTLAAGTGSVTARVTAVQDTIDDDDETVLITATHNTTTIGTQQTVTITDDDDAPTLSADGDVCERTAKVRDALLAEVQANDATVADCSQVTTAHLEALTGTIDLSNRGIASLKLGDMTGLTNLVTVFLNGNGLTELPVGIFAGLTNLEELYLYGNNLRSLPDEIFEDLASLRILNLSRNRFQTLPDGIFQDLGNLVGLFLEGNAGSASFRPAADAGTDGDAVSGRTVALDGSASEGGPWGTNITYAWAVADGEGDPVTDLTLTGGDTSTPSFITPETVPGDELEFTLTVQGRGGSLYKSTDSVNMAVRPAPTGGVCGRTSQVRVALLGGGPGEQHRCRRLLTGDDRTSPGADR